MLLSLWNMSHIEKTEKPKEAPESMQHGEGAKHTHFGLLS
mgnify:CR=1 FL=1